MVVVDSIPIHMNVYFVIISIVLFIVLGQDEEDSLEPDTENRQRLGDIISNIGLVDELFDNGFADAEALPFDEFDRFDTELEGEYGGPFLEGEYGGTLQDFFSEQKAFEELIRSRIIDSIEISIKLQTLELQGIQRNWLIAAAQTEFDSVRRIGEIVIQAEQESLQSARFIRSLEEESAQSEFTDD